MIIVDTSVWIDHFRHGDPELAALLSDGDVATHPFVVGELACGGLKNRAEVLALLSALPSVAPVTDVEFGAFLDHRRLWGQGLGLVDVHLLAAATLSADLILTRDKPLLAAARKLKLSVR